MNNKNSDIEKTEDGRIIIYAYGIMYEDENGVIRDKILGPLSDLNDPKKLKELNDSVIRR